MGTSILTLIFKNMISYSRYLQENDNNIIIVQDRPLGFPPGNEEKMEWLHKCQDYLKVTQEIERIIIKLEYTYENSLINPNQEHRKVLKEQARAFIKEAYATLNSLGPKLKQIEKRKEKEERKVPGSTFALALGSQYNFCAQALQRVMCDLQCQEVEAKGRKGQKFESKQF